MHLKVHGKRTQVLTKIHEWLIKNIDNIYEEHGHRILGLNEDDKAEETNQDKKKASRKAAKKNLQASVNRKEKGISKEAEIVVYRKEKVFNWLMDTAEEIVLVKRQDKRKRDVAEIKELVHPSIPYERKAKAID